MKVMQIKIKFNCMAFVGVLSGLKIHLSGFCRGFVCLFCALSLTLRHFCIYLGQNLSNKLNILNRKKIKYFSHIMRKYS